MLKFWSHLSSKEKLLISTAGFLLAGVMLVVMIFKPVYNFNQSTQEKYHRALETYGMMETLTERVGQEIPWTDDIELRRIILDTATSHSIKLARLDSRNDGLVLQVNVTDTDSRILFKWMVLLEREYAIDANKAIIRKSSAEGFITADIEFSL